MPGPQQGRYASEPAGGVTSLADHVAGRDSHNASARLALDLRDTIKRIDGTEVPLTMPWLGKAAPKPAKPKAAKGEPVEPKPGAGKRVDETGVTVQEAPAKSKGRPVEQGDAPNATPAATPEAKAPAPKARKPRAKKDD